jgi:hypothetical protein
MKMNVTKLLGAAALFALPLAASAAENFSYRYVDVARYMEAEIDSDDVDVDGDGIQLRGSLPVYQNFFALAEYEALDLDGGIDTTRFLIGGGGHWPLGTNLDFIARGGLVSYEVDAGRFDDDDTGLFIGARIRTIVAPKVEVEAGVEHFEFDVAGIDGDTYIIGEGRYNFTSQWSAGAIITIGGDQSVIGAQGRFNF